MSAPYWEPLAAAPAAQPPAYGTSLPASPVDGQEAILVDSITNPSWQWRFRYNAGSTYTYKWECVGGNEAYSFIVTQESPVPLNTWAQLPTPGPDFVLPRSGDYVVSWGAQVNPGTNVAYVSVADASVGPSPLVFGLSTNLGAGMGVGLSGTSKVGVAALHTLRMVAYQTASGCLYANRWLTVKPIRVS